MKVKLSYVIIVFFAIAVLVGGFFGYREYMDLRQENQRLSNPEEAAKTDIERTKEQVGQLIVLPDGEEPTVANVVDVSKLEGQEFFKNAENGDKLLVYQEAQKAILYRPSIDKIIEVSTIDLGEGATEGTQPEDKADHQQSDTGGDTQSQTTDNQQTGTQDATLPGISQ